MNYIEQVYGFQNPSIINQQNFNLSFEMYSLQQNLKNHIDYSFKRLCSDLHQMFQFSPGKSKFEKDTFETAFKERFYQDDNHKLNSLESEMRLNKRQTKPCKYATKCKYLPKDKCWFSHATVVKVESAYQQNGNPYESMKFQNQCMGELAQFAPEIDKIESDRKNETATNSR